jgi:hypothetical protein
MIIKIKQGAINQNSWRFHDGVHEFAYANVGKSRIPFLDGVPYNEQMGIAFEGDDGVVRETHFVSIDIPEYCLMLTFIDFNGKPHEVYTDAPLYLLNDNGKTIERLT